MESQSKYDVSKTLEHLRVKWNNTSCPMCGTNDWSVAEEIFELREFQDGNLVAGGPLYPVIPVSCKNCGMSLMINAIVAGVLPKPNQKGEEKK